MQFWKLGLLNHDWCLTLENKKGSVFCEFFVFWELLMSDQLYLTNIERCLIFSYIICQKVIYIR